MKNKFYQNIDKLTFHYPSYQQLIENLYLSAIIDSFQRLQNIAQIGTLHETEIRNHLAYDLENTNHLLRPYFNVKTLKLTKENTILESPTETKRTDIEFFISWYGDFVVECKKLDCADQRYVDEGIDRFVTEKYSKSDTEAAMIGFVVKGYVMKIIDGLKPKIEKCHFVKKDKKYLTLNCVGYQYSFHSKHDRKTKKPIYLHHLFVDL